MRRIHSGKIRTEPKKKKKNINLGANSDIFSHDREFALRVRLSYTPPIK